jgi:glycopeptide antibiotics resistance protein
VSRRESGTSTWPFLLGLIALLALIAALTLLPIGWKMNRFVVWLYYDGLHLYASPLTAWLYFDQLSFLLNVLLTVPIGLLARFAFPRLAWWVVGVAVLVLSGCVEVAHLVLPLGREATWGDVASNTIGGFAGAHRTLVDSATGSRRAFRGAPRG